MIDAEFAANPDPRCACLLLLDTSGSMAGAPIDALNAGLRSLQADLQEDALAKRRVEIAIITFGGAVKRVQDFVSAGSFVAPTLSAGGGTPMGEAIHAGIEMVKARKAEYRAAGIAYYQPWVFLITDGAPTDFYRSAAELARAEAAARSLTFFAVAVGEADTGILHTVTDRVLKLDGLSFSELFLWVSQSQKTKSQSKPGDQTGFAPITFGSPA